MLAFSLSSSEGSQSRVPSAASVMRSPFLSFCWYPERARSGAIHPSPTVMEAPSMNALRRAEECHRFRDFLRFGQALDRECRKHHLLEPYVAAPGQQPGEPLGQWPMVPTSPTNAPGFSSFLEF